MSERAGRIRMGDWKREHGRPQGDTSKAPPPVLTLRRTGCRDRLGRVYVTPDGFYLLTDSFTVTPDEWLQRPENRGPDGGPLIANGVAMTVENLRAGLFTVLGDARTVRGLERLLPLDLQSWDTGARFELGCEHAHGWMRVDDLRDRVTAAGRAGRERRRPPASAEYVDLT